MSTSNMTTRRAKQSTPSDHERPLADKTVPRRSKPKIVYRRSMLMIGLVAIAAIMSVIAFTASQYDPAPQGKGLQFVIPAGASATVDLPAIDSAIAIPTTIVFKAGEPAVLTITNQDAVANRAGPWVIGPGQTYTAKFDKPGTYEYVCSVEAAESVTIVVEGDES